MNYIDIVFDGPPGPTPNRFLEVENEHGESIKLGEWIERPDGHWALRLDRQYTKLDLLMVASRAATEGSLSALEHRCRLADGEAYDIAWAALAKYAEQEKGGRKSCHLGLERC